MIYYINGVKHSSRPRIETREDKYGQCIRLSCLCGKKSNWHTSQDRAVDGLYQNHEDSTKETSMDH